MYGGFAASLALVFALPAAACGGLEGGDGSGASTGSANVSGLRESGVSAATSGASGPERGASAGIPSGGSGALVSSTGSGSNLNSGSGMDYARCGPGASLAPVSFVNQIMPIFQSNCSVGGTGPDALCHGDPSAAMPSGPRRDPTVVRTALARRELRGDTHDDLQRVREPAFGGRLVDGRRQGGRPDAELPLVQDKQHPGFARHGQPMRSRRPGGLRQRYALPTDWCDHYAPATGGP
jgi:hypothetical protein